MHLLITVHAILYYHEEGEYYVNMVYGYDFYKRYLSVFEQVRIFAFTKKVSKEELVGMLKVCGPNVEVFPIPYSQSIISRAFQYLTLKSSLKKATEGIDAAVLRIPEQLPFQMYGILKSKRIPTAVEVVVDPWNYYANKKGRTIWQTIRRYTWTWKQKQVCKEAIGASYVTSKSLQAMYKPRADFDTEAFTASYTSAEINPDWYFYDRKGIHDNQCIEIIHVSTNLDNNGKGYLELLECLHRLLSKGINVRLTLVGGGSLRENAQKIVDDNKLGEYIRYTGKISNKYDLRKEYIAADFMVFPTYGEGLPRTIIEAMGTGLVCISTNVNGVVELLDNDDLVEVGEVAGLEKLVLKYMEDPEHYTSKSKRNLEQALQYSSDIVNVKRTEFYQKLRSKV